MEVKRRLDAGEKIVLVDVREPEEIQQAHIAGAEVIPMGAVPGQLQRIEALGDEANIIVVCHHGVRSLQVAHWLRGQGVEAQSMSGGIDRWSREIDASVPRYF